MTALTEINEQLRHAEVPVARALHTGPGFRVLLMGFNSGMLLEKHVLHHFTKLFLLEGELTYRDAEKTIPLTKHDTLNIPADLEHELKASADSLCMLIQG